MKYWKVQLVVLVGACAVLGFGALRLWSRGPGGEAPVDAAARLRELEKENARLRALLAEGNRMISAVEEPDEGGREPEAKEGAGAEPDPSRKDGEAPAPITSVEIREWLKNSRSHGRAWKAIRGVKDRAEKEMLMRELLAVGDGKIRRSIVDHLDNFGGREGTAIALDVMRDENEQGWLRHRASRQMARNLGVPELMGPLRDWFLTTDDLHQRFSTAVALKRAGDAGPTEEMVRVFNAHLDDVDGAKRQEAVDYLEWLPTSSVVGPLSRALKDTNSYVRMKAVEALGRTGLPEVRPLLEAAAKDPVRYVRDRALHELEEFKTE